MTYLVINRAEDGTYENEFDTLSEAAEYLTMQSGYTVASYYSYAYDVVTDEIIEMRDRGHIRIMDDYGRTFTIVRTEEN